ncbi:MAG: hypothetical protein ABW091_07770 [Microbacterium sp.]
MTAWINTVSRDHVERAVAGGFTQANHGKPHNLRRLERGDWIAFSRCRLGVFEISEHDLGVIRTAMQP